MVFMIWLLLELLLVEGVNQRKTWYVDWCYKPTRSEKGSEMAGGYSD